MDTRKTEDGTPRPPGPVQRGDGADVVLTEWVPPRPEPRIGRDPTRNLPKRRRLADIGSDENPLIVNDGWNDIDQSDLAALSRAMERNRGQVQLYDENRDAPGRRYARLPRMIGLTFRCTERDVETGECYETEYEPDRTHAVTEPATATRISVDVMTETPSDDEKPACTETTTWTTDVFIANPKARYASAAGVRVLENAGASGMTPELLADLLYDMLYDPGRHDGDDAERKEEEFAQDAHYTACRLLLPREDADERIVRYAFERHVRHLLPKDADTTVAHRRNTDRLSVSFSRPPSRKG